MSESETPPGGVGLRMYVGSTVTPRHRLAHANHIELRPGEEQSVTAAFVLWTFGDSSALFAEPGEHLLQVSYWITTRGGFELLARPLSVVVQEPEGDDAIVAKMLREQRQKAGGYLGALNYREIPAASGTTELMQTIVNKYPKSSYADYARLVLAYHYYDKKDPAVAQKHLRAINMKDFSYGPDVLLWWGARDHLKAQAALQANFPDAIEWLEKEAEFLTFDQIQERRNLKYYDPHRAAATLDDLFDKEPDNTWAWAMLAAIVAIPSLIYFGVYWIRRVASKRSAA